MTIQSDAFPILTLTELSAVMEVLSICADRYGSHRRLMSTWNVVSASDEKQFNILFIFN